MYIVINGGGKVSQSLASILVKKGLDIAIIEKREDTADKLVVSLNNKALVIVGDGCDKRYQDDAGVARADVFVSATGDDDDNLVACQLAKVAFGVTRCIARVNNPKNTNIFQKLGIEAICSTNIIARMIVEEATMGDLHTLKTLRQGNLALMEIELNRGNCPVNNKPVSKIKLPPKCRLVAVIPQGDEDVEVVTPETILECGDSVIVLANPKQEKAIYRILSGEGRYE